MLTLGNGLSWNASQLYTPGQQSVPAPVPLPPASWLLESAIVGWIGISRRRKT